MENTIKCEKLSFETFAEGQTVVNQANNIGRRYGKRKSANKVPKRVYKCPYCDFYHLTSQKHVKPQKRK